MAYEFQKLADVEAVEEFPEEGASVLIEHEGSIKRCSANGIGGASGIPTLITSFDPETEEPIIELEDGRSADEFAKDLEESGYGAILCLKMEDPDASPGVDAFSINFMELSAILEINEDSSMTQLIGCKKYTYEGGLAIMNFNENTGEKLDHYVWAVG